MGESDQRVKFAAKFYRWRAQVIRHAKGKINLKNGFNKTDNSDLLNISEAMRRSSYIKRETHAIISTGEGGGINEFVANDISQLKKRSENMEKSLGFLAKKFINLDEKIDKLLELGVRPGHQDNEERAAVVTQTEARGMFGRKKVKDIKAQRSP